MTWKSRGEGAAKKAISRNLIFFLCLGCFCAGLLFSNGIREVPESEKVGNARMAEGRPFYDSVGCIPIEEINSTSKFMEKNRDKRKDALTSYLPKESLEKKISRLEMELAAARAAQDSIASGSPQSENLVLSKSNQKKYFMVIGINTAFSSRKRRDSVRATWMPQGEARTKLEEKGIIVRFVIGHSSSAGGILDRAIAAEDRVHGDFMRLEHVEGYLELSAKTRSYFASAVNIWDAEFYVKVDDDVHVNIATLRATLSRHLQKPRVYIGCMKSGPVLAQKGVRYHEPEYWKFGEAGNKYFRHATGQLYAISKDLASYISINQNILHKYANEDVSLGSWLIGLDVNHIDERKLCCGTPRLRVEGPGRQCMRCFVRLDLQRNLQVCRADGGSSSTLR